MRPIWTFLIVFAYNFSVAQRTKTPDGMWTSIGIGIKLNEKWTSITDVGYRTYSADFIPYTNYIRTGIRHNLNKKWSYGGFAGIFNQRTSYIKDNLEYQREVRLYGELSRSSLKKYKGIFSQRWRLEQKYFQATSKKPAINYQRASVRILGGYQLTPKLNIQTGPEWYESFINNKITFDQFRWNAMVGIQTGSGISFTANYFIVLKSTTYQNIFQFTLSKNLQLHEQHH